MSFITNVCKKPGAGSWDMPTKSVTFNGSDEAIDFGRALTPDISDAHSISWWSLGGHTVSGMEVFACGVAGDYDGLICRQSGGKITHDIRATTGLCLTVSTNAWDGLNWQHIVVTKPVGTPSGTYGTELKIYQNGVEVEGYTNSTDWTWSGTFPAEPTTMLGRFPGHVTFFAGKVAGVSYHTTELSSVDVARIYAGGWQYNLNTDATAAALEWWTYFTETTDLVNPGGVLNYAAGSVGSKNGSGVNMDASNLSDTVPA